MIADNQAIVANNFVFFIIDIPMAVTCWVDCNMIEKDKITKGSAAEPYSFGKIEPIISPEYNANPPPRVSIININKTKILA